MKPSTGRMQAPIPPYHLPHWLLAVALMTSLLGAGAASARNEIAPFVGSYSGSAEMQEGEKLTPRDLAVKISASGKHGFKVRWTSITYKEDGRKKRSTHTIDFQRSKRQGVYRSAMRENMFGQQVPNDPIDGAPYVWATLQGKTLVVYALHVLDGGHYEVQSYKRTLVEGGLDLEFERLRDGKLYKSIKAKLTRTSR